VRWRATDTRYTLRSNTGSIGHQECVTNRIVIQIGGQLARKRQRRTEPIVGTQRHGPRQAQAPRAAHRIVEPSSDQFEKRVQ